MSHYLKDLMPLESTIAEASSSKIKRVKRAENEELHRYALFEKPIKMRGPDGRTYDYRDEDGEYVSHFISQYSPLITDNIEPGVKLLVRMLHGHWYLTMGSCQGHEDSQFRWVSMVFTKPEELSNFKKLVDGFKLPITWYDNFVNFRGNPVKNEPDSFHLSLTWDQKQVSSNRSIKNKKLQGYTEEDLTKYLNVMYSRNETKYYLTKMVIASKMGKKSIFEKLKWRLAYRNRDSITENLLNKILTTQIKDN